MAVRAFAAAEELGAAPVVNVVKYLALSKEHQRAEEGRAVYRAHTLLHLGEGEGVVICDNFPQYHLAYCRGAYACFCEYLLDLVHRVILCGLSPHPYRR